MKANELRIGNMVEYDGKEVIVNGTAVNHDKSNSIGFHGHGRWENEKEFSPILINEEWLLKFGFSEYRHEKFEKTGVIFFKNDNYNVTKHINFEDEIVSYNLFINYDKEIELKYVHQLQNLYFALTNEELEIKEP